MNKFSFPLSNLNKLIKPDEKIILNVIAVLIGIATGLGSVFVHYLLDLFTEIFYGVKSPLEGFTKSPFWKIILVLSISGLVVGLIIKFLSNESKGSGVTEVMISILTKGGYIKSITALYKAVTASLSIAAGASVGSEGPMVQIGGSLGSAIGRKFVKKENFLKILVAAGAGGGISAAFNAPMAGALFAAEVILGDFSVMVFSPLIISSITSMLVTLHFYGKRSFFEVPFYSFECVGEYLLFGILGVITGLFALVFIWSLFYTERLFEKLTKIPSYLKTVLGGVLLASIGIFFPKVLGSGFDIIPTIISENTLIYSIIFLLIFKLIATTLTISSGFSGGSFVPSLFLGAGTGVLFGSIATSIFNLNIPIEAWGVLGMAGVVSGTIQGPITATLIIFEMTQNFYLLLPLMLTSMISSFMTMMIKKESIYTQKLLLKGIKTRGYEQNLKNEFITKYVDKSFIYIEANESLKNIISKFFQSNQPLFPVVNNKNDMKYLGILSMSNIKYIFEDSEIFTDQLIIAGDLMEQISSIYEDETILNAIDKFSKCDYVVLPVVDYYNKLVGLLHENHLLSIYQSEHQKRIVATTIIERKNFEIAKKGISISDSIYVNEVKAPEFLHNKSLKDLNFRNRFDLEIILIHKKGSDQIFPFGSYVIAPEDYLTILGSATAIESFINKYVEE